MEIHSTPAIHTASPDAENKEMITKNVKLSWIRTISFLNPNPD